MRNTISVDIILLVPGTTDELNGLLLRVDKYDPTDIREAKPRWSMADCMEMDCPNMHLQSDVMNWCEGVNVDWIDNQIYYVLKNTPAAEMDYEKEYDDPASWER